MPYTGERREKDLKLLTRFYGDRRGSGIITVIVCMMLVIALGSTLLFASYTGYMIKVSEKKSTANFYSTDTAMSEIRAGIQGAVTKSIAAAYSSVLVEYNTSADTAGDFRSKFKQALYAWSDSNGHSLFSSVIQNGNIVQAYVPSVLPDFLSVSGAVTVTGSGEVTESLDGGGMTKSIALRGISVRYAHNGYETNISTDIVISMPDFNYTLSEYSLTGIPQFALIADNALTQNGDSVALQINGNAYAGNVDLSGSTGGLGGSTLTVSGGSLICGGDVAVKGRGSGTSSRLILDNTASLWAGRISVGNTSSVSLNGDNYVADDLTLAGDDSNATLSGRYYGFGYLENGDIGGVNTPASSSSININGKHTTLDLSGLNTLVLSGQSFVNTGSAGNNDVLMGQSVSVKNDQRAYLIPPNCLSVKANPYLFTGNLSYSVDLTKVLWGNKTLGNYINADHVQVVTSSAGSAHIAYFFMKFDTKEAASQYFKDYFSYNSGEISRYLKVYSDVLSSAQSTQSSGTTYDLNNGVLSLLGESSTLSVSANRMKSMYKNLCVTLSSNIPYSSTPATSPFGYTVNTTAVSGLTADLTPFRDSGGTVKAVIIKNSGLAPRTITSILNQYGSGVCLILATGDVTVDSVFHGLILSAGTISMSASVYADSNEVTAALRAADSSGNDLLHYMNVGVSQGGSGQQSSTGTTWDPGVLVAYANWKKH